MDGAKMTDMQRRLYQDYYDYLVRKNEESVSSAVVVGGEFLYGHYAEFVFSVCEELSLTHECRFLALELFNKFMHLHLVNVNESFGKHLRQRFSSQPHHLRDDVQTTLVSEFISLLKKQVPLRILSCIQLASKAILSCSAVTPVQARSLLLKMKANFSLKAVCESEIRVWKSLSFSAIVQTPFSFIEFICEFLGTIFMDSTPNSVDHIRGRLFDTSCQLLQYLYIIRPLFYYDLYRQVTKNDAVHPEDKIFIARISADNLLIATGIVSLSTYLIWGQAYFLEVVNQLRDLTKLSDDDISDCTCVFGKILGSPNVETIWKNIDVAAACLT